VLVLVLVIKAEAVVGSSRTVDTIIVAMTKEIFILLYLSLFLFLFLLSFSSTSSRKHLVVLITTEIFCVLCCCRFLSSLFHSCAKNKTYLPRGDDRFYKQRSVSPVPFVKEMSSRASPQLWLCGFDANPQVCFDDLFSSKPRRRSSKVINTPKTSIKRISGNTTRFTYGIFFVSCSPQ
jgi:hypothetical protein